MISRYRVTITYIVYVYTVFGAFALGWKLGAR